MTRLAFEEACWRYPHRFTMEHVPAWARGPQFDVEGTPRYYAPTFATDRHWYDATLFPGDTDYPFPPGHGSCYTGPPAWPLGKWLPRPYAEGDTAASFQSRWKCPSCGSQNVEISLPTWFTETCDGTLTYTTADEEADPLGWHCQDCQDSGCGEPIDCMDDAGDDEEITGESDDE